jgi:hypothetical protein
MGRQRGLVHLSGQFGDMQLSVDGKNGFARSYKPDTGKRIKADLSFDQVRKNNSEFGAAALVVSALVEALGGYWQYYAERYFQPRLKGKVRKLVNGPGLKGQRRFEVGQNLNFFRGIDLDATDRFDRRFMAPYQVTVNADRNMATLDVGAFHTLRQLDVPGGATHFHLLLTVGVLTDFMFVEDGYEPSHWDLCGHGVYGHSALMACDGRLNPGFQMVMGLPGLRPGDPAPVLPADAALVVGMGISFFRVINGVEEVFASGGAMKVEGAY